VTRMWNRSEKKARFLVLSPKVVAVVMVGMAEPAVHTVMGWVLGEEET